MKNHLFFRRLAFLVALSGCFCLVACKELLQSGLSEPEVNEVVAVLMTSGVDAGKTRSEDGKWQVEVAKPDFARAVTLMKEHGLPRAKFTSIGEVFKKEGLVSTPSEERIRFIYAMSQELSATLSLIDGVVLARVHPVLPANDPLVDRVVPASASVFIKHRPDANLAMLRPAIKNLVMTSIEGLNYDNISLTFVPVDEAIPGARPEEQSSRFSQALVGLLSAGGAFFVIAIIALSVQRMRRTGPAGVRDRKASLGRKLQDWSEWVKRRLSVGAR